MTKINWKNDAEVLTHFQETNSGDRRILDRMGVILSERVVRRPIGLGEDIYVEVETPYASCCFVLFESGHSLMALVMKNQDVAMLNGTWRKRGHIVGHATGWIEAKTWLNGKLIKRTSKKVLKSCSLQALGLACVGQEFRDPRLNTPKQDALRKIMDVVSRENEVAYAKKILAGEAA